MKTVQRYLIAKYVPDVRRMEPRNIGIVVWCNGRTAARFLPVDDAAFVNDPPTYQRWVDYWTGLLDRTEFRVPGGEVYAKDKTDYLDGFAATQKENYLLIDGGEIIGKVPAKKTDAAAEYLFTELVAGREKKPRSPREENTRLRSVCARLFSDTGLSDQEDFKTRYPVACAVGHVTKQFTFNYAEVNGHLRSVYQRVPLSSPANVYGTAFMFQHLGESKVLDKGRCAALVQADEQATSHPETAASLDMLREFATVINVSDYDAARDQLSEFAGRHGA